MGILLHTVFYFMYISNKMTRPRKMLLFLTVEYIARNLDRMRRYIYIASIFMRDRNSWTLARVTRSKSSSATRGRCIVRATVLGDSGELWKEGFIVTTISPWAALAT